MNEPSTIDEPLARFIGSSGFGARGAVITDLDGTAVHEREGLPHISPTVEAGLAAIHQAGHQVIVNTMRFPQSVIRVFGREWHRITGHPIPLISLNGSQTGWIRPAANGEMLFDELDAFPLLGSEIREVMEGVRGIVAGGGDDLLVFFYPRDWTRGECIWTPRPDRIAQVQAKYRSASRVFHDTPDALEAELQSEPICMLFLLIDAPEDRLMAYQHTEITRFVTHAGVDKRHGAIALADHLKISLADSIGAGDARADNFLEAVGFAVIVGPGALGYHGLADTVRVDNPAMFGRALMTVAAALG
jgi:hydroxymethylpyrimidine pyrophosphatase-like HAD family hydrolase